MLGGSFEMYLGQVKRAPRWMQRSGTEWLYRFVKEPRRLFHRYFVTDTRFVATDGARGAVDPPLAAQLREVWNVAWTSDHAGLAVSGDRQVRPRRVLSISHPNRACYVSVSLRIGRMRDEPNPPGG